MKPQGVVLYAGKSLLDRTPIVAVATGLARKSQNNKTGQAIQVYILADDGLDPIDAKLSGGDYAICGECPHAGMSTCYVNLVRGPLGVWKAYQDGRYPRYYARKHAALFRDRYLRLGAYGDPAAVPIRVWKEVCDLSSHWTGYTHQWRECHLGYAKYLMASVDTEQEARWAQALGYRTFRIRLEGDPLLDREFVCPASAEGGKRLSCEECGACNGKLDSPLAASPVIIFHGPTLAGNWSLRRFREYVEESNASQRISLNVLRSA